MKKDREKTKVDCPPIALLRSYKVYPREIKFDYFKVQYFLYVYLDPFKSLQKPLEAAGFCFGFEPFYVGKGAGTGYRQNHHVQSFANRKKNPREVQGWNSYKLKKFEEIEKKMEQAAARHDTDLPWDWNDYKDQWIIIAFSSDDPNATIDREMSLIKGLGVVDGGSGTRSEVKRGPLINRITNSFKQDGIVRRKNRIYIL